MKRNILEVDYGSSDESDSSPSTLGPDASTTDGEWSRKKSKKSLPALSTSLVPATHFDNPALHQGRRRAQPHVDGQFVAHVYVPIILGKKLKLALRNIVDSATKAVPELHSFTDDVGGGKNAPNLHVSLSRPVYLRAHQREAFKAAIKSAVQTKPTFEVSFAQLTTLINDEKTRIFLSVEIGAGHTELKALTEEFTPHLNSLRQDPYYAMPRFHLSIAWALLSSTSRTAGVRDAPDETESNTAGTSFRSISELSAGFVDELEAKFGSDLRSAGRLTIETIEVKIGKAVTSFSLQGQ